MRKTTKKGPSKNKREEQSAEETNQPTYINIRETTPEIQRKQTILWTLVLIFTVILAGCWLLVLRVNIKREASQMNLNQLGQQISDSLSKFDTEIKTRTKPTEINIDDLDSIKQSLEEQIKNNPDSSLWPTHEFSKIGLMMQYPNNWNKLSETKTLLLSDSTSTEKSVSRYGKITIALKDNSKKLSLENWLNKNSDLKNYQPEKSVFIFSSTTPENSSYLQINTDISASSTINRIYFINSTSSKKVIEIKTESIGDDKYYKSLLEEIIRTIKII